MIGTIIEVLKNAKKNALLLQLSFLAVLILHHYSHTSDATAFIGFWQLAWPMHLQNSEQVRLNLTQEQSDVLHPILQPQPHLVQLTALVGYKLVEALVYSSPSCTAMVPNLGVKTCLQPSIMLFENGHVGSGV